VWVNGADANEITTFTIRRGTSDYVAPLYTSRVVRLRMPLGQMRGGTATIRRIYVTRGRRTVDLAKVPTLKITTYGAAREGNSGARFRATSSYPFLDVVVNLEPHQSRVQRVAAKLAADPIRAIVGFLLMAALATVAVGATTRRGAATIWAVVATVILVQLLPSLTWHLGPRDSVATAVSHSSYVGVWKARERLLLNLAFCVAVLAATASALLWRRRSPLDDEARSARSPQRGQSRRWGPVAVASACLVLLAAALPNLRDLIRGAPRYQPAWDANNLIFWRYLQLQSHLRPIRDFFWPYGYQWLFYASVPWGAQPPASARSPIGLTTYFAYGFFWVALLVGSYWFISLYAPQKVLKPFIALAALLELAVLSGDFWFDMRYVAPLAAVMVFAGLGQDDRLLLGRRVFAGATLAAVALLEVAQVVYAIAAICLLAAYRMVNARGHGRETVTRVLVEAATIALPVFVAAATYAISGALRPTVTYYRQLGAIAAADGFPSQIDQWIKNPASVDAVLFWCVPLAVAIGITGAITSSRPLRSAYMVVAALGVLSFAVTQKQVLRPSIASQIWLPCVFPLGVLLVVEGLKTQNRFRLPGVVAVAAIAATFFAVGGVSSSTGLIVHSPARAVSDIRALVADRKAFRRTNSTTFAPQAFENFGAYEPVAKALRAIPQRHRRFWVLGDDSPLVMMTGTSWPYYFTDLYDSAPIAFQKEILTRLERYPPTRTIWNFAPSAMAFDQVPQVVRTPLLFTWAVQHLVPSSTIGTFAILRMRRARESLALGWWRRRIGESIDLGQVPTIATLPKRACSTSSTCGSYAIVTVPERQPVPVAFDIPVRAAHLKFDVKFAAAPGVRRYVVPLDRLWFWASAKVDRRVVTSNPQLGARVVVVHRRTDPNRLY